MQRPDCSSPRVRRLIETSEPRLLLVSKHTLDTSVLRGVRPVMSDHRKMRLTLTHWLYHSLECVHFYSHSVLFAKGRAHHST